MPPARISLFSWGYEGWGNATKLLVRSVDEVERARRYKPPVFVDIRMSRSVRAIGFRDRAFEKLLGHARYRWMRSLGNAAIKSKKGGMRIQCPDAAEQLLDLAIDAAEAKKRIIFFCSCPSPHGGGYCHRGKVTKLLLRAARRRGVRIEVQEWPGGAPSRSDVARIKVSDAVISNMRKGAKAVPLATRDITPALHALPWGTMVELASPTDNQIVSAGPPVYRARRWQLPIFLFPVEEGDTPSSLLPFARRERTKSRADTFRS